MTEAPVATPKLGWWWVVAPILALGLLACAFDRILLGGYLLAAGAGLGAIIRLVLPKADAGGLAVRSRLVDVTVLVGFALALAFLTSVVDLRPLP
nr:DUF3017 domain-containing protein [Knoellia sp. DB2414S]